MSKNIFSALLRRAPVATSRRHGGQHDELGSIAAPFYQRICPSYLIISQYQLNTFKIFCLIFKEYLSILGII